MKKLLPLLFLAGCAAVVQPALPPPYDSEPEMRLGQSEHIDYSKLFDEYGCMDTEAAGITENDMPCLDLNNDGCVTRENWDLFMHFWSIHTPEPDVPLCQQM
ncbi:MAG: hypothetical protein FWE17_00300 [Alphaproteobacteria bacterium]|nr:hypothetical protein [Alphaproteobacteria bacterium]MCL2757749.1 hypothetical protein [Alphaproteobacteria bacterium]